MKVPVQIQKPEMKMKLMHSCGLSKLTTDIQDPRFNSMVSRSAKIH